VIRWRGSHDARSVFTWSLRKSIRLSELKRRKSSASPGLGGVRPKPKALGIGTGVPSGSGIWLHALYSWLQKAVPQTSFNTASDS